MIVPYWSDGRPGSDLEASMIASRSPTPLGYFLGTALAGCLVACLGAILVISAHDRMTDGPLLVVDEAARPSVARAPHAVELAGLFTGLPDADPMRAMQHLMTQQMRSRIGFQALIARTAYGCSRATVWRQRAQDAVPVLVLDRVAHRCADLAHPAVQRAGSTKAAAGGAGLTALVDRHVPTRPAATTPPF